MASLADKVALITGGAQGLGKAFTEALLKRGARVCMADIDQKAGETTLNDLSQRYGKENAAFVKCDVTSQRDVEDAFNFTKSKFGALNILCNNAGISNENQWESVIKINLIGVIRGTLLGIEHMSLENGGKGGVIINTASMAGLMTTHVTPSYCASKFGVVAFTRCWAKNPNCVSMGLKFHSLCPSFADTAIMHPKEEGSVIDRQHGQVILKQLGVMSPETVAEAFMQLVDKEGTNGEVLSLSENHGVRWETESRL